MAKRDFTAHFWGTRGSIPVSSPEFVRYGGNSSCVEMRCGGQVLIFDAGSGLKKAGLKLESEGERNIDLFFSHCHWDHVIGIPFFKPFYCPGVNINVWSGHLAGVMTTREMVDGVMRPPYFPVGPEIFFSNMTYHDFKPGEDLHPRDGITLRTASLNHPNHAVGYRIEYGGKVVAYVTDTEHTPGGALDQNVLRLIDHADLVIYDSALVDEEMQRYEGFGHSTWQQGVRLCKAAQAKRLAIFHHSPLRDDKALDKIAKAARAQFPGAFVASDDLTVSV